MCFEPQHPQALRTTPLHPRIDAISLCHFQVEMGLKIHPEFRTIAKVKAQPKCQRYLTKPDRRDCPQSAPHYG
jgi:hypothetical protein